MQVCVSLYFEFCTACPAPFVYTIPDCYEQDRWQKLCAVKGGFGWGCSWPQNTTACTMCTHQSMHHVHTPRAHTTACTMCTHHVHTPQHAPCAYTMCTHHSMHHVHTFPYACSSWVVKLISNGNEGRLCFLNYELLIKQPCLPAVRIYTLGPRIHLSQFHFVPDIYS